MDVVAGSELQLASCSRFACASALITKKLVRTYDFRERSSPPANLQVQLPKTKQKFKIKMKKMLKKNVKNLKNEFAQTNFEGIST